MATRNNQKNPFANLQATRRWLRRCDDQALLEGLHALVADDCEAEAELLSFMAEVDQRKLYRERAFPSMFQFAVEELHLSEGRAYKRIAAARTARTYPALLERIARGELHLSAICLLAPHLTPDNHEALATKAMHKSKRAVEKLLAEMFPKPAVAPSIRKLPAPRSRSTKPSSAPQSPESQPSPVLGPNATSRPQGADMPSSSDGPAASAAPPSDNAQIAAPAPAVSVPVPQLSPGVVEPLSVERYRVTFTAEQELVDTLNKAQELLGPGQDNRDLAAVFGRALDLLVRDLEKKKHAVTPRSRANKQDHADRETTPRTAKRSRSIPRAVRRAVYERDQGQCAYRRADGRRCTERSGLEYHHRVPFARGGEHTVANLELRCRCHNALAAEEDFGRELMASRAGMQVREQRAPYVVRGRDVHPNNVPPAPRAVAAGEAQKLPLDRHTPQARVSDAAPRRSLSLTRSRGACVSSGVPG